MEKILMNFNIFIWFNYYDTMIKLHFVYKINDLNKKLTKITKYDNYIIQHINKDFRQLTFTS